jgi:hypothetical protein
LLLTDRKSKEKADVSSYERNLRIDYVFFGWIGVFHELISIYPEPVAVRPALESR